MKYRLRILLFTLTSFAATAHGATITAEISDSLLQVGDTSTVDIYLNLNDEEEASVFEASFDLAGLGSVVDLTLTGGGSTWDSPVSNIDDDRAFVSLTSGNTTGSRLVASFAISALAEGTFDIYLAAPIIAAFDLDDPPFIEELSVDTAPGSLLASVTVSAVPLPAALPLFLGSLAVFGILGKNNKR